MPAKRPGKGPPPALESVESVLRRTSLELMRAVDLIDGSQASISKTIDRERMSALDVQAYQGLDRAVQSITAISDFVTALGRQFPAGLEVSADEAAKALLLSDVANRLKGICSPPPGDDDDDVTFFS